MQDVWFYIRYWIAALLFILGSWLSSCQPEAFDTAPYESYVLYDGCLTCLDWGGRSECFCYVCKQKLQCDFLQSEG